MGRQVQCDVGRVDIVGRGADGATVLVELKAGEAKDSAIGQIARLYGMAPAEHRNRSRHSDFPDGVQYAALAVPNLALRRYRIQLTFENVEPSVASRK